MFKVGIRGLLAHKGRLLLTVIAIAISVMFLSGTLVLGDTMRAGFKELFSQANENVAVVVRGGNLAESDDIQQRANVPLDLQSTLEGAPGVAEVEPEVVGLAQITGSDGKAIGGAGPPTFGAAWSDSITSPWHIAEGRAPTAQDEVVINRAAADVGKLAVGDTTTIRTPNPLEVTIVGIAMFGESDGVGGATYAGFTFDQAQQLFIGNNTQVSDFAVVAQPGVSPDQVKANITPLLPEGVEAITSDELTKEQQADIDKAFLGFFETLLVVFSLIALVVAAFTIYNTFAVILAQKTRESALLRAIGASRRQVLSSMALEGLIVGLVASLVGLALGIVLAWLLRQLMELLGSDLPTSGVVVTISTVVWALLAGIGLTFLASVGPTVRASGIPPIAALRDVAIERTTASKPRIVAGALLAVLGVALVLRGAFGSADGALVAAGFGAFLSVISLVVLGPLAARPGATVIGRAVETVRGLPGRFARENSVRNPKRTSSTASALMVGVALVALITTLGSSVKTSFNDLIGENLSGDLFVFSTNFGGIGFSPALTTEVSQLPEVDHAAGVTVGLAQIDGKTIVFTSSTPSDFGAIVDPDVTEGSLTDLQSGEVAIARDLATRNGWVLGTQIPATFIDGSPTTFTVAGIYDRPEILNGIEMFVPLETWAPHNPQLSDQQMLITLADGVSIDQGKTAIQPLTEKYGAPDVMDRQEYIDLFSSQIDFALIFVYVLLFFSILIAAIGIVNTLALSIFERSRELGLLRAVGQSRKQMRSMIRWESVIIALFGTFGGLVLGVFLGWGLMAAFANDQGFGSFDPPTTQLVVIILIGGILGVLAGLWPAWRASRMNILESIAAEG